MTHLTLFFTRGISLQTWAQNGSLEREVALYLRLQQKGVKVSFVTYGNQRDLHYQDSLHGIEILYNRWNLPMVLYETLIPFLHANVLRQTDVIKSNQTNGADVALRAARIWRKPMIARCGYMWSDLAQNSGRRQETIRARQMEGRVFEGANTIIVTTMSMKEYIIENYQAPPAAIHVIPNYVLTDLFLPIKSSPDARMVCFVGRLSGEKNLHSLIQACAGLNVDLHFIGDGELYHGLMKEAKRLSVKLTLHGSVAHLELPAILSKAAVFTLVSPHEGHPKSLLEAMSCGIAVLGADSPGIREQIRHGETGWLTGTDAESIHAGIRYLLADRTLREELGRNARRFVLENYSLDTIVEQEFSLIQNTIGTYR